MSAVATRRRPATAPRPYTVTRIFELRRDGYDRPEWVEVDVISTRARANVALSRWLLEQDDPEPLSGTYRAENDLGGHAEQAWTGT
ncbi:MAG TPA: hypothetical protein VEW67_03900 [Thermoleophilaceae bacterium]|nr:hypothetical protein [Thermoleophilaceae bacterium]